MLSPISEVVNVSEVREDKNGRSYKLLRLQGITETEEKVGGKVYTVQQRGKRVSITQYEESYLNNEQDPFFDAEVGDMLGIEIFTAQTKPYEIVDDETGEVREVTSYTYPVIRGDNPVTTLENADRELAENTPEVSSSAPVEQEQEQEEELSITQ